MNQRKHKKARLLTMDELHARPCEVDGRPALFHRWVEEDQAILKINTFCRMREMEQMDHLFRSRNIVGPECSTEILRNTFALVEYRDGTIAEVDPERICFIGEEGKHERRKS